MGVLTDSFLDSFFGRSILADRDFLSPAPASPDSFDPIKGNFLFEAT